MAQQTPPGLLALLSTASPPQHPSGSSHRAGVWGTFTHLPDKVLLGKGMLSYGKGLLLGFPSMSGVPTLPIPLHSPPTPPPGSCKSPFQQDFAGFSSLFSSFVCPAAGSNAWGWGEKSRLGPPLSQTPRWGGQPVVWGGTPIFQAPSSSSLWSLRVPSDKELAGVGCKTPMAELAPPTVMPGEGCPVEDRHF